MGQPVCKSFFQLIHKTLQYSKAYGHLQLVPQLACQFHSCTLTALLPARRPPNFMQLDWSSTEPLVFAQSTPFAFSPEHQQRQALSAVAARLCYSNQAHPDEDLRIVQTELSENEYHKLADATLDFLQEKLEVFVEDMDIDGGDVEHAQGVLTVKLGQHGTYVINKQTPNRQIWLSSPLSGPFRYDYHNDRWVYHRDGRELLRQLQQELQQLLGKAPELVT